MIFKKRVCLSSSWCSIISPITHLHKLQKHLTTFYFLYVFGKIFINLLISIFQDSRAPMHHQGMHLQHHKIISKIISNAIIFVYFWVKIVHSCAHIGNGRNSSLVSYSAINYILPSQHQLTAEAWEGCSLLLVLLLCIVSTEKWDDHQYRGVHPYAGSGRTYTLSFFHMKNNIVSNNGNSLTSIFLKDQ